MKQVFQKMRTGETVVLDVPVPEPQTGQALVRTSISLVSAGTERMLVEFSEKSLAGKLRSRPDLARQVLDKALLDGVLTTLNTARNRLDQPFPLGYSCAGTIIALGQEMNHFKVGQRVACAGGGYAVHAEFCVVPKNLISLLGDPVDFESAAFATLGAIALHGFRLAEVQVGSRVAVIGLGLLGLLTVAIARSAGCRVMGVDPDPNRSELSRLFGAESVLRDHAESYALSFTQGYGCDAVLICADTPGNDPVELAGAIARDRANVVSIGAVGQDIPRKIYYAKELTYLNSRSYGPGRYDPAYELSGIDYPIGYVRWTTARNMQAFVDLLAEGRIDVKPLISHRFPVEEAPAAYNLITGKTGEPYLAVLLTYPESPETAKISSTQVLSRSIDEKKSDRTRRPLKTDAVSIGVLGAGAFASNVMLPIIKSAPHQNLVGIASITGKNAKLAGDRFGFSYATSDEFKIIDDPQIDTIVVLTRHNKHASQVISGLKAGKNVFCEKPLAINPVELGEIEELLINIDKQNDGTHGQTPSPSPLLFVGFNRRFAPFSERLKAFTATNPEPLMIHYRVNAGILPYDHWLHDPLQGGGRIIGEACHFIDYLVYLVGDLPDSVTTFALPDNRLYREDNVVMTFTFPNGSLGTVHYLANGDKSFPKEHVEVFQAGRIGVLDNFRKLEFWGKGKHSAQHSRLSQNKGHREEWSIFINAVQSGGPPPILYSDLIGVTRASFAALNSLRTAQTVQIR